MRGRVREVVIYFKFHESRSRGLGAVGVENRPLPLTRPMAYNSLCTTVQAVMKRLVSSAYNLTVLKGNPLPISSTYIRESSGPSIVQSLVGSHMQLLVEKKKYFVGKHIADCYLSNPGSNQTLFHVCHIHPTFEQNSMIYCIESFL